MTPATWKSRSSIVDHCRSFRFGVFSPDRFVQCGKICFDHATAITVVFLRFGCKTVRFSVNLIRYAFVCNNLKRLNILRMFRTYYTIKRLWNWKYWSVDNDKGCYICKKLNFFLLRIFLIQISIKKFIFGIKKLYIRLLYIYILINFKANVFILRWNKLR